MRRTLAAVGLVAVAASVVATAGAARAQADGTPVQFTVSGAGLAITQPTATASLTGGTLSLSGSSVSGKLGSTTVSDLRGGLAGSWTVTATGPASFSDGAGDTVATNAATLWVATTDVAVSPLPTSVVRTDLHLLQASGLALSTSAQTLLSATTVGTNSVTYNPSIAVTIPNTAVAGTYAGTITQTVQ